MKPSDIKPMIRRLLSLYTSLGITNASCFIAATVDVKKNIFDLCTDSSDLYLAVIEQQRSDDSDSEESVCRVYEVSNTFVFTFSLN